MKKTYTIQKTQFNETSKNKATIDYYLIDEKGNQRTVNAVAKLGFGKKIKSVSARYYRETPLVQALSQADSSQKIEVGYTAFNKKPRVSLLSMERDVASSGMYQDVYNDMLYKEKMHIDTPNFAILGMLSILAFVLWMVYMSISTFS